MMAKINQKMIQTISTLKMLGMAWTRALTTTWEYTSDFVVKF